MLLLHCSIFCGKVIFSDSKNDYDLHGTMSYSCLTYDQDLSHVHEKWWHFLKGVTLISWMESMVS